jgi:hypothetical protein
MPPITKSGEPRYVVDNSSSQSIPTQHSGNIEANVACMTGQVLPRNTSILDRLTVECLVTVKDHQVRIPFA